ncbi:hypothetical protein, partial [Paracoccus jiaweipingae]|uniref:hypothetical protein n=1 Tax=Paracoccus sp. p2-l61 TaxID=3366950 RepID=UPI003796FCE6
KAARRQGGKAARRQGGKAARRQGGKAARKTTLSARKWQGQFHLSVARCPGGCLYLYCLPL